MFVVNDDLSIYATRGDIVFFSVSAKDGDITYKFQPGDIVRMSIYGRKDAEECVMQKDFPVTEVCEKLFIFLEEKDTKIGDIISKHKDYWYEVVLNPDTMPQTIIGYDEDGAKVFRLFPESEEIDDNYEPSVEDFPVVDTELDMTSPRPVANQAIARAVTTILDTCERTNAAVTENIVTPEMYGAIGDGVADDVESLQAAITANRVVELNGHTYAVSGTIELTSIIKGGTIVFNGDANATVFNMKDGGGLENVKIVIKTSGYAGSVILADYTIFDQQYNPMRYTINGLIIDNTVCDSFIEGSCCFKIRYDKYKVIYAQNISNVRFDGHMDYGIYIEPVLRNESDNPVFNTATFSNFFFHSVNCAIKVLPVMDSGSLEEARGGVSLLLDNFANQYISGINKAFMDIHNTTINGVMVIPWDYYGSNIPAVGTYVCANSKILLDFDYFPANTHDKSVKFGWTKRSTGEMYSNYNSFELEDIGDRLPLRNTGIPWGVDNVKLVRFKPEEGNPYGNYYTGLEFQLNNSADPQGVNTVQVGFSGGYMYVRTFLPDVGKWGALRQVYSEGTMPLSYIGKRPDGKAIGDMKFDTTVKKPVWWNGSAWILADGSAI